MKAFSTHNPRDLQQAVTLAATSAARRDSGHRSPAAAAICWAW